MNILEKKKKISKNQQKINIIKKNGKSANEHLTQTEACFLLRYAAECDKMHVGKGHYHEKEELQK